jgi:inner membrane protein
VTLYTHALVGLGLAHVATPRPRPLLFWLLAGFLPILPDFDVFTGLGEQSMLGHRGLTHSLLFAAAAGLLTAALTFRYLRAPFWPLAGLFFAVTASHGVLDAFNSAGAGIPFLWPHPHRFGPYGPIHYPDVALELPDPRHSLGVRDELRYVWPPTFLVIGLVSAYRLLRRRGRTSPPA